MHWWTSSILDLLVAICFAAVPIILLTGGIDLRVASLHAAERPILALALLLPLRLTLGGSSLIVDWARGCALPHWFPGAGIARLRPSPAVADVMFALITTRLTALFVGFLANLLLTPARARGVVLPFRHERLAEIFVAWDSGWYFDIARRGYYFNPDGQSSIAFFPLYPLLMRGLAWPFGASDAALWSSGIVISWSAFACALLAVHRLTERIINREAARRAVLYLALFPFAVFFTRVYAESVFRLTSVLAISRDYDQRWWQAGLWGALATNDSDWRWESTSWRVWWCRSAGTRSKASAGTQLCCSRRSCCWAALRRTGCTRRF